MDRFIFRVWDGKDKKMMPSPASIIFTNDNQWRWFAIDSNEVRVPGSYDKESVVMRFVGICDKNGNEIYEGDIIKIERTGKYLGCSVSSINIVKFGNYFYKNEVFEIVSTIGFYLSTLKGEYCSCDFNSQSEVIGNVFENPELLENKQ